MSEFWGLTRLRAKTIDEVGTISPEISVDMNK